MPARARFTRDLFTDDARYVEHFWGELHGRDEIRVWIDPVMSGVPEIYTVLEWSYEEDYWDVRGAGETAEGYAAACRAMQPDQRTKLSRKHRPEGPAWARFDGEAKPTWLGRDDVRPITKPRELRQLLAPLRENR